MWLDVELSFLSGRKKRKESSVKHQGAVVVHAAIVNDAALGLRGGSDGLGGTDAGLVARGCAVQPGNAMHGHVKLFRVARPCGLMCFVMWLVDDVECCVVWCSVVWCVVDGVDAADVVDRGTGLRMEAAGSSSQDARAHHLESARSHWSCADPCVRVRRWKKN